MRALRPVLHPACAAVLLAGALVDLPALAQTPKRADTPGYPEPVIQWGVQKDETCDQIALAVWGSVKHAALVTRYNRVRCAPGVALPVGTTLVLPEKPTTLPTARLGAVNPDVRSHAAGGGWAPAETGAPLYTNHVVNTLDKGRADIRFVDRTRVYMAANTLVVVYGTAAQTSVSKAPPPVVQVDAGEVKVGLAALRGDDAVDIGVAGGGRVSAHTREAVVEKKGQRTTVAVYDGKARVTSAGKSVDVPEKFASRFVGAAPPSPPRPLPPAPAWVTASVGPAVGSASDDGLRLFPAGQGVVSATWGSVPDARAYRFEIARDEAFHDLIAREEVAGGVHAFRAERLPAGTYWYAVRAIDKEDYLGLATPRKVRIASGRIDAAPGTVEGAVDASPYGVLVLDPAPSLEISVDGGPFGPMPPSIDLARRHPVKIALREGQVTTELAVHYRPAHAVVRAEPAAADHLRVAVTFEGLQGVDVEARVHPSLKVSGVAGEARVVPLARSGDAFVADVPARGTIASIDVVDGRGRWLGRGAVPDASAAPSPARRPPLAGPATYVAPALSALTDVAPFAPTPHDAAGFAATVAGRSTGGGAQGLVFASGGVGLVGVDAAVRTGGTGAALVADGGAWLGARARVLRLGDPAIDGLVELAPALRVGLPFVGSDPPVRLEPAVAVGGVRGRLSFLADAGARVRVGDATAARASVPQVEPLVAGGVSYDLVSWLRASALLDAEVLVKQPGASSSALFRGGLTLGAEAGGVIYGGAFARVSPFPEDGGVVAGQLAIGVRGR